MLQYLHCYREIGSVMLPSLVQVKGREEASQSQGGSIVVNGAVRSAGGFPGRVGAYQVWAYNSLGHRLLGIQMQGRGWCIPEGRTCSRYNISMHRYSISTAHNSVIPDTSGK